MGVLQSGKGGGAVGVSGSEDGEEEEEMALKKAKKNPAATVKAEVCFWCMRVHKTIIYVLVYTRLLAFAVCLIIHNDYFS